MDEIIWLMCHYPDTAEMDERMDKAVEIQRDLGIPIWLFGTSTARYPDSVEIMIKRGLMQRGAKEDQILCSCDLGIPESLDTIQEIMNVLTTASNRNIKTVLCISNRLHLLQVYGFSKRKARFDGEVVYVPTRLRDWRLWYVSVRLALIPLAFLGIGRDFPPLKFVRHARSSWTRWPF